jgi:hypothetical protein
MSNQGREDKGIRGPRTEKCKKILRTTRIERVLPSGNQEFHGVIGLERPSRSLNLTP